MSTKLNDLKKKAICFWEHNKGKIIFLTMLAGCGFIVYKQNKKEEESKIQIPSESEETPSIKSELTLEPATKKKEMNCGGEIFEDSLEKDGDYPEIIVNEVPFAALGEFGKEVLERAKSANPDIPQDVDVDKIWAGSVWLAGVNLYEESEKKEEEAA